MTESSYCVGGLGLGTGGLAVAQQRPYSVGGDASQARSGLGSG